MSLTCGIEERTSRIDKVPVESPPLPESGTVSQELDQGRTLFPARGTLRGYPLAWADHVGRPMLGALGNHLLSIVITGIRQTLDVLSD